ncbi:hypothetical protein [Jiangella mangrovi]|uniref:Uncharacterized protein n=1 Tax=Jiangella mangrovi TaxID=1524084 RepID=A0A7W9LMR6_9ACTN|nr:hypothetical protein [Jiangella mangrovi]MBB5789535.1 hypothetical protein [Jiangella mangrovi]
MTPRQLAAWARGFVAYDGGPETLPLVTLDGIYDDAEFTGLALDQVDEWTIEEARVLVAGAPSRFFGDSPLESRTLTQGRPRRWRRSLLAGRWRLAARRRPSP